MAQTLGGGEVGANADHDVIELELILSQLEGGGMDGLHKEFGAMVPCRVYLAPHVTLHKDGGFALIRQDSHVLQTLHIILELAERAYSPTTRL